MPRYAILSHDYPVPHWDLFLEAGTSLRSWRLLGPLSASQRAPAEPTAAHRLAYLDYEGPVSGGRGSVCPVDAGHFTWEVDRPDLTTVFLAGDQYTGRLTIRQAGIGWLAHFEPA